MIPSNANLYTTIAQLKKEALATEVKLRDNLMSASAEQDGASASKKSRLRKTKELQRLVSRFDQVPSILEYFGLVCTFYNLNLYL